MALIEVLIEGGLNISQRSDNKSLKSIDLGKIMELVRQGAVGNLMEVEASDGDIVDIIKIKQPKNRKMSKNFLIYKSPLWCYN